MGDGHKPSHFPLTRRLCILCATHSTADAAIARLLSALSLLRDLSLAQLQCDGDTLSPLAAMRLLHRLRLASCHLTNGEALGASLASASALESLAVQSCDVQTAVCQAVAKAAPVLPRLRELELVLSRPPAPEESAALAAAAATCAHLTSLDLHFPSHSGHVAHAPGWAGLAGSCGPSLRRLHVCTGLGWEQGAFAVVAAAATGLRELLLTDNASAVEDGWMAALGGCARLSSLDLGSCGRLGPGALASLCRLSALTSLVAYRCPGLGPPDWVIAELRGALPCLTLATVHG